MIPYFTQVTQILAKITSKNQLTLPKHITQAVESAEYFDVQARDGQIILTPVRIQRADAVRAKLAELGVAEPDVFDAVAWARQGAELAGSASSPKTASSPKAKAKASRPRAATPRKAIASKAA